MAQKNFKVNNGLTTPNVVFQYNDSLVTITPSTSTGNYTLTLPINDGNSGQVLTTDGSGVLSWGNSGGTPTSIVNGNSNVVVAANANVTISANGNANIVTVTSSGNGNLQTTGVNVAGYVNSTANINAANFVGRLANGTSNIAITSNANITLTAAGTSTMVVSSTGANITGTANVSGNLSAGNISTTALTANGNVNFTSSGNVSLGSNANVKITGGSNLQYLQTDGLGNLTWATVTTSVSSISNGNSNVSIPSSAGNVNISSNGLANIVTVSSDSINGVVTVVGNIVTTGGAGNISGANVISANTLQTTANGAVVFVSNNGTTTQQVLLQASTNSSFSANYTLTLPVNDGANGQILSTDGNGVLSWVSNASTPTSIVNGNSNVVVNANANVTISSNGQANVIVVTNTGANIAGTANITGDILAGANINVTSNINGATFQNGNSNITITSNANITLTSSSNATMVITNTGANITGTLNANGNANLGNLGTSTAIITTGNITTVNTGLVQNGNSNIAITSNANITLTAKSNATMVITDTSANITGNANISGVLSVTGTGVSSIAGNINMNGKWVGNIGYAVLDTDAASKLYVDTLVTTGVSYHAPVNAATTTTLDTATSGTAAYNEPGGAGNGIGAYISTTGTFTTIDGVTINGSTSIRILVKDEANAAWNGVYTYTNANAITRSTDADEYGVGSPTTLSINDYFFTQAGTVNAGTSFIVSGPSGTITFGTSNITFSTFSTSQVYTGGTGITISGTVISANANQSQVTQVGTLGNLSVTGNATAGNLIGPLANGNSNVNIPTANGNVNISAVGNANVLVITGTGANITGTGNITGDILAGANINVTSNINGATFQNGNSKIAIASNSNVTISSNGQSNIVTVSSDNTNGLVTVSGNITGANVISANTLSTTANGAVVFVGNNGTTTQQVTLQASTAAGFTANYTLTLPINDGDSGQYLQTNGTGTLSWSTVSTSSISNGNSNVSIPAAAGNVNISSNGVPNVLVVTSTGANIAGTANITGDILAGGNINVTSNINGATFQNGTSKIAITSNANITLTAGGNSTMIISNTGANITGTGNFSGNLSAAGQITSTRAGNLSDGGGQLYLNGSGNNRIDFNTNGTGAPTFTTRSAGTKIALYPSLSGSAGDYALGVDSGTLWTSLPAADAGQFFKWYGGTTEVANLSGTGVFQVVGNANVGNLGTTTAIITTGNITTINTGLVQNGNSNVTITANANISLTAKSNTTMIISDTGANITGTLNATGNANVGNLGTATAIITTGNITTVNATTVNTGLVQNGNSNVAIASNANLTIASNGVAGVVTVTEGNLITGNGIGIILTSNNGTGIRQVQLKTSTDANFTGNYSLTLPVNDGDSGQYLQTNGSGVLSWASISTTSIVNGNSNVVVNANANVTISSNGQSNVVTVSSDATNGLVTINGNLTANNFTTTGATGNIQGANVISANTVKAATGLIVTSNNGTSLQQVTIQSSTDAAFTSNYSLTLPTTNGDSGQVLQTDGNGVLNWYTISATSIINGNSNVVVNANANVTISSNGQANIINVSSDATNGLVSVTGNLSANNIAITGTTGNITGANIFSTAANGGFVAVANNGTTTQQVTLKASTDAGFTANYTLTLPVNDGDSGQYLQTNGSGVLSWASISTSSIVNGNSNVVVNANANVTISSAGNANIVVVTGTGANISGTANVSGNISAGGNLTVTGTGVSSIAGNIDMNGKWVGNIGYAVANTDAASKLYVDTLVSTGISYHAPVNAATVGTLASATGGTIAYNQPGGAGNGIGAFISTTGTFTTIDGVTINGNTSIRILVKDEANAAFNGVYTYTNATAITRSTDTDQAGVGNINLMGINDYFYTQAGNVNAGTSFIVSAPSGTITFGTSNIIFSVFSTSQIYTGGTGITVAGTVISANAIQTQITQVGTLSNLSVTGNTTSGNFIGIFANGNSNISIPAANGNVNISAAGNANILVVTGTDTLFGSNVQIGAVNANSGIVFNANTFQTKLFASNAAVANYSLYLPANVAQSNGLSLLANTDGTLRFASAFTAQPTIKFTAPATGNNQTFTNANIASFGNSTAYSTVFRNGVLVDSSDYAFSATTLTMNVVLVTGDTIAVASTNSAAATPGNALAGGSNSQVQFNDDSSFGGNSTFTFNKTTATLTAANVAVTGNLSGNTNGFTIGYLNVPQVAASNTTLALSDAGKHYYSTSSGNFTLTVPNNSTVSFATGTAISIVVNSSGNVLVNAASGVTLYLAGFSVAGNRVIGGYGMATLMKVATNTWFINGTAVT